MTNVTAGDLAYITGNDIIPKLKGRFVKVLRRYNNGETLHGFSVIMPVEFGVVWVVEFCNGTHPVQVFRTVFGMPTYMGDQEVNSMPIPDGYLRRITGPGIDTDETTNTTKPKEHETN